MSGEKAVPCMPIASACRTRIIGCACGWVLSIPTIRIGRAGGGFYIPASIDSDTLWAEHAAARMSR